MSDLTRADAVAVSATIGTVGNCWRSSPSCLYSGRKSLPHSETQCASSIAKRRSGSRASAPYDFVIFSGVM